jgi:purine-cytosine permease-like protein
VVFSTLTTAFLDLYSAAVSSTRIINIKNRKIPILVIGLFAAVLSAVFPAEKYSGFLTSFLTAIGMVFAPVYAVIFIDFFMKRPEHTSPLGVCGALPLKPKIFAIYRKNLPCKLPKEPRNARNQAFLDTNYSKPHRLLGINLPGLAVALGGMAVYSLCARYEWAIPTLLSIAAVAIIYIPISTIQISVIQRRRRKI